MSAQHRTSRLIGQGKQLLASNVHSPRDTSELAAAIATVEHRYGARRQASRLFADSLRQPTENALAQALWAKNADVHLRIPMAAWSVPSAFEAEALSARAVGDWDKVVRASIAWLGDEPFSLQAAGLGSTVCFVDGQLSQAERIATDGLRAFPQETLLLNNRAVIRAYLGEIEKAEADIIQALASPRGRTEPYLMATVGLLAYRTGDSVSGAELYGRAMHWFNERKEPANALLAALYWMYEEVLQGSLEVLTLRPMLDNYVRRIGDKDCLPEMNALLARIDSAMNNEFGVRTSGLFSGVASAYLDKFDMPDSVKKTTGSANQFGTQNRAILRVSELVLD